MMNKKDNINVLFVCMGNICRSPTAEAVFRARVEEAGLLQRVLIDSAGTHNYHIGNPPDMRTQQAARLRGYDMSLLRGRQVSKSDFTRFDYILAMDHPNLVMLYQKCPSELHKRLGFFMDYATQHDVLEVPDPYHGGVEGFVRVLDMVEDASKGLLQHIQQKLL